MENKNNLNRRGFLGVTSAFLFLTSKNSKAKQKETDSFKKQIGTISEFKRKKVKKFQFLLDDLGDNYLVRIGNTKRFYAFNSLHYNESTINRAINDWSYFRKLNLPPIKLEIKNNKIFAIDFD